METVSLPQVSPRPTPDDPVRTLRAEVRRAGGAVVRLRRVVAYAIVAPCLGGVAAFAYHFGLEVRERTSGRQHGIIDPLASTMEFLLLGGLPAVALCCLAFALASAAAVGARRGRRRALMQRIASLPGSQQLEVLLPDQSARGETGRIVRGLLRDLNLPTELTPAATPEGSGTEVRGVELA